MSGPVRAFERQGQCRDCGWIGGLDDGLCILCQNREPVTTDDWVGAWPTYVVVQCASCGGDHEAVAADICPRCEEGA